MSDKHKDIEHWSRIATEWMAWARAPNHDAFWAYRGSLLAFIGQGAGDALDVGCGEGRVSRVLKECGYRVTAIDPVEKLVSAAEQAGSADAYGIAAAADLPFENCSFDLVVAYNVLMDVEEAPSTCLGWVSWMRHLTMRAKNFIANPCCRFRPRPGIFGSWKLGARQ
jgi:2-polyprenyl-3-methyl-5-hydroxy-6-metoxy-1,4-benzoquinol methylase